MRKKQSDEESKATLLAVRKEMAKPRVVASACGGKTNRATSKRKAKRF